MYIIHCAIQTIKATAYHEEYVDTIEEVKSHIKTYIMAYRIRAGDLPQFIQDIPDIKNHQTLQVKSTYAFLKVERNDNLWILDIKK